MIAKHWSLRLSCHACGKVHRNMAEESRHRHNFPALCKRNAQFKRFIEETSNAKAKA